MSGRGTGGARNGLRVVEGGLPPRRDAVARLHQFQGDHPEVQFTSPASGRYGQFTALIPPGTIRGESREIIAKSADLCGLMDQLGDLFTAPAATDAAGPV
jgi:hypothetical protein